MTTTAKEIDDLLRPVMKRFKDDAHRTIMQAKTAIMNVHRVLYDAGPERRPADLPAPRLQLRWEDNGEWICHYELVFPLREHDIRNDAKTNVAVVELSKTRVGGGTEPWSCADPTSRLPFRDGSHAQWDSAAFNGLPIFVISPDGSHAEIPRKQEVR